MKSHTDSVETNVALKASIFENDMGGFTLVATYPNKETVQKAKELVLNIQTTHQQQVSQAYTKGRSDEAKTCTGCQDRCQQQVDEAVRKERERIISLAGGEPYIYVPNITEAYSNTK